jgi:hypothetical protein
MEMNKIEAFNEEMRALTGWKKFRYVMAFICFIIMGIFVFDHLGFVAEDDNYYNGPIFSSTRLWIVNGVLGIVGGILFAPKNLLIAALSGLVSAAAITGATIFYLSWRDAIYIAEITIPLLTGLIGIGVYKSLKRNTDDDALMK